jgi:hypothetical protein
LGDPICGAMGQPRHAGWHEGSFALTFLAVVGRPVEEGGRRGQQVGSSWGSD